MASRKKKETPQASLFGAIGASSAPTTYAETVAKAVESVAVDPDLDELELSLPAPVVATHATHANDEEHPYRNELQSDGVAIVLHTTGQYLVTRVRHGGGAYAGVLYTRAELEQLVVAATEALR